VISIFQEGLRGLARTRAARMGVDGVLARAAKVIPAQRTVRHHLSRDRCDRTAARAPTRWRAGQTASESIVLRVLGGAGPHQNDKRYGPVPLRLTP
jgi:hypothetical protein